MSFQGSLNRLAVTLRSVRQRDAVFGTTTGMGAYAEVSGCEGGGHRKKTNQPIF